MARYICGSYYKGEMFKGRKHGKGYLKITNGDTYEGAFKDGKRDGYGVLQQANKQSTYKGDWQADGRHGHGEQHWQDGARY